MVHGLLLSFRTFGDFASCDAAIMGQGKGVECGLPPPRPELLSCVVIGQKHHLPSISCLHLDFDLCLNIVS